jgi:hypothetical protein
MNTNQQEKSDKNLEHADKEKTVRLRIQTPRGLWSMDEPKDAQQRPRYPISTKVERVIEDARSVFKFVEQDSKYTLLRGNEKLEPQRTLASYKIEDGTLLVLSVQGGNA